MTDQQLEQLCDELLSTDICQTSAVLSALSADELETAYEGILHQYGLELVIGASDDSDWRSGMLVIAANQGSIHFCQTAFYAIRLERQRRKASAFGVAR